MATAVELHNRVDRTDVPHIIRCSIVLGVLESALVLAASLITRFLDGATETVLLALVVLAGLAAVSGLPGVWTRARTIEGIAGAAGIGLGAAAAYLLVDVALLQPIGTYTNRWREIGGGSTWWYHPVWWMVGTYLPWMGAWTLANQAERESPSVARLMTTALAAAAALAVLAIAIHVPGARWSVATFALAFLPGIAVATLISGLGRARA